MATLEKSKHASMMMNPENHILAWLPSWKLSSGPLKGFIHPHSKFNDGYMNPKSPFLTEVRRESISQSLHIPLPPSFLTKNVSK